MKLGALAVRRPIGTLTVAVAVVVFGAVATSRLAVDLLPSVDSPQLSITTFYEGVAPEEIETLITRPIEQAVSTVEGLVELNAVSSEGLSRVQLRFEWGHDLETAINDVREMLDRIRARLPEEAEAPTIYKFDLAQAPIAQIGVSGTADARRLRYLSEEVLSRRLERVPGVARADVRGGRVREVEVRLSVERLAALSISARDVAAALERENRNVSAGDMLDRGREVVIRVEGELNTAEEFAQVVVTTREGRPILISDLGEVVDGYQELSSELWVDGDPGLTLRLSKQSGSNTVEVMEEVLREVEAINGEYQGRLKLTVLSNAADFIRASVTNVQSSVLLGASLAVFILLYFLRNMRATLVVATAIPISVMATFALMFSSEVSLNVISLGGLALGVGMLVDGAIVILESTYRKMEEGLSVPQAAIAATAEVGLAVVAGALTTIAVFVPVVFIEGFAGVFFREMALVVSFALAASLAVALTVVPALSALVLKTRDRPRRRIFEVLNARAEGTLLALERVYERVLRAALRRRWATLGLSTALLLVTMVGTLFIGVELMPETDEGEIDVDVELPVGTPLEETMAVMKEVERRVLGALQPGEFLHITTSAGPEAPWQPVSSNRGSIELTLTPVSERERGIDQVMADVRRATRGIPGAEIRARKGTASILFRLMRGGSDRLTVEVHGHDVEVADRLAARVREVLAEVPGVTDTFVDREPGKMEQTIRVDRGRLAELGLTGEDVGNAVETYVLGTVPTRLREGGTEYDVRVRLREGDRLRVDQLAGLPIPLPNGGSVPLGSIARFEPQASPASIARLNQERIVRVGAGTGDRPLDEIAADLQARLRAIEVPEGFSISLGGELQQQGETFSGLLVGVLLAVFLVYAVLVIQFESLKQPLIIMTSVPFAAIGAIAALLLTQTTFNMNSFLGMIVLVGIVVNNAIILVEYTNQLRERGMSTLEALVECGKTRLRPVLMTTLTTILGMLPLALGLGEGSEIQAPLGRVVVGGLAVSTLVTLVFVPALYLVVDRGPRRTEAGPATVARAAAPQRL